MFKHTSTRFINWIIMITLAILVFELMFFGGGLIFTAVFFGFLIYIGWKNYNKMIGKIVFWVGLVTLALNILNLYALRFLFGALILLVFLEFRRTRHEPEYIKPEPADTPAEQTARLIELEPLFQNRFFGTEKTSESPYQWRDINIHGGFGDRIIDLGNTVIPDGAIVSIRHGIGNIVIFVPYEVEISIVHSTLFGNLSIFRTYKQRLVNKSVQFQTADYDTGSLKVKIVTSVLTGDVEVRRV